MAQGGGRRSSLLGDRGDEVSPLELFFDLAFVFAVSQLSEHLVSALTWRGALETLVLLVAVFGLWSFTSWGVSFPQGGRFESASIFAVLLLALLANASIPRAFDPDDAAFAIPFVVCLVGQVVFGLVTAGAGWLRAHYRAMLVWTVVAAALWTVGALVEPGPRLAWWAAAALLGVVGSWTGHPLPGRRFRSGEVSFEPGRMVERSRLFLLIALGESVLTIGTAFAAAEVTAATVATAVLALAATSALWFLYFGGAESIVDRSAEEAEDRLRVARIAVDSQLVVLAGLIALAVGGELAIEDPLGRTALPLALVLHAGPILYLAAQTWYLHALTAALSRARLAGIGLLVLSTPVSLVSPPLAAVAVTAVVLVGVVLGTRLEARSDRVGPASATPWSRRHGGR